MTIFRHRKSGQLHLIAFVSPHMCTGSWYEAVSYLPNNGSIIKNAKLGDFVAIAYV